MILAAIAFSICVVGMLVAAFWPEPQVTIVQGDSQ